MTSDFSALPSSLPSLVQTLSQPERLEQPPFNEAETEFLSEYLNAYAAVKASKKGDKKKWVESHVYPKYTQHFDSARPGGPNLLSLLMVCTL